MTIKTDVQLARKTLEDYFSTASVKIVTADVVKSICALIERLKNRRNRNGRQLSNRPHELLQVIACRGLAVCSVACMARRRPRNCGLS